MATIYYKQSIYSIPKIHDENEFILGSDSYLETMSYKNKLEAYLFNDRDITLYTISLEGYVNHKYKNPHLEINIAAIDYDSDKLIKEIYKALGGRFPLVITQIAMPDEANIIGKVEEIDEINKVILVASQEKVLLKGLMQKLYFRVNDDTLIKNTKDEIIDFEEIKLFSHVEIYTRLENDDSMETYNLAEIIVCEIEGEEDE